MRWTLAKQRCGEPPHQPVVDVVRTDVATDRQPLDQGRQAGHQVAVAQQPDSLGPGLVDPVQQIRDHLEVLIVVEAVHGVQPRPGVRIVE